jgi:hypothetical protein
VGLVVAVDDLLGRDRTGVDEGVGVGDHRGRRRVSQKIFFGISAASSGYPLSVLEVSLEDTNWYP